MKKIAWITDSTCGLSAEFIADQNIHVIPLNVIVDRISYREDIDLSKDEFYEKLKIHGEGAKTSQPAFGDFIELYNYLKTEYDCGIAMHASSSLTGTYQSSIEASKQTGFPVEVIDSKIGAYALGKMVSKGIALEESGSNYEEIVKEMNTFPDKAEMYLLPQSLEQLKKSGRVSTTQMIFASLLNIFLILTFDQGKVVIHEKIRTKRKTDKKIFEIINDAIVLHQLDEVCIMHAGVYEQALIWKENLENLHSQIKFKIETLVPVAGVHTGHGTMAVSWLKD